MQHYESVLCSSSLHLFDQKYRKNIVNSLYTVKNKINKMLEGQKYLSWANFIAWP